MEKLLTARQAYEYLNVHRTTFARYVRQGLIPSIILSNYQSIKSEKGDKRKVRRYRLKDLEQISNKSYIPVEKLHKKNNRKDIIVI